MSNGKKARINRKKIKAALRREAITLGLIIAVFSFGLFAVLMFIAVKQAGEETMLQISFTIPAWELVAVIAFVGMAMTIGVLSFLEHKIIYGAQMEEIRVLENRINKLWTQGKEFKQLAEKTEEKAEINDEIKEELPYEELDDYLDSFIGLSPEEMDDIAKRLFEDSKAEKEEPQGKYSPDSEPESRVIHFTNKNTNNVKRGTTKNASRRKRSVKTKRR